MIRLGAILTEISEERKKELFDKLAKAQRGKPESAMLKVQHAMGGGVLNPVVEHIGDLTHRMAEKVTYHNGGYEAVEEKLDKILRYLDSQYGFEREFEENLKNNSKFNNISYEKYKQKVERALKDYANAHRKLKVYNEVQRLARDAAVDVGMMRWDDASRKLKKLKRYVDKGREFWTEKAHEFNL